MKFSLNAHNYFEIFALITSIFCWPKLKNSILKHLPLLLGFIVTVELAGKYIRVILNSSNAWLYNFSTIIEFIVYTLFFYNFYKTPVFKKIAKIFLLIFPVIAFVNIFFIQGFWNFHSYTMVVGSFFMILFSCLYFYEVLQNAGKINLTSEPMFWISTGILFFYAGDFFYNLFFVFIFKNGLDDSRKLFSYINNSLILLLYSCFSIGLICQKKVQI